METMGIATCILEPTTLCRKAWHAKKRHVHCKAMFTVYLKCLVFNTISTCLVQRAAVPRFLEFSQRHASKNLLWLTGYSCAGIITTLAIPL